MDDIVGLILAIFIMAVCYWLLSMFLPIVLAAVIALLIFLALVFGRRRFRGRV
jgi:hypothetical protein